MECSLHIKCARKNAIVSPDSQLQDTDLLHLTLEPLLYAVPAAVYYSIDAPQNPVFFQMKKVTGCFRPDLMVNFNLIFNVQGRCESATQMQLSYDFNGNGVVDRIERYRLFQLQGDSPWECYTEKRGLAEVTGPMRDLENGTVTMTVWNAYGSGKVFLDGTGSTMVLPFSTLKTKVHNELFSTRELEHLYRNRGMRILR